MISLFLSCKVAKIIKDGGLAAILDFQKTKPDVHNFTLWLKSVQSCSFSSKKDNCTFWAEWNRKMIPLVKHITFDNLLSTRNYSKNNSSDNNKFISKLRKRMRYKCVFHWLICLTQSMPISKAKFKTQILPQQLLKTCSLISLYEIWNITIKTLIIYHQNTLSNILKPYFIHIYHFPSSFKLNERIKTASKCNLLWR